MEADPTVASTEELSNGADLLESINDESQLRSMLDTSEDFELRRRIRARLRELKKSNPGQEDGARTDKQQQKLRQQKVVKPRETSWATTTSSSSSSRASLSSLSTGGKLQPQQKDKQKPRDETDGKSVTGGRDAPTISLRHVTDANSIKARQPASTSEDARREMQKLSLRPVSSSGGGVGSSKMSSNTVGKSSEFLEGITLRKVDAVKISVGDASGGSSVRPSARTMNPRAAMERFKEIDAAISPSSSSLSVTDGAQSRSRSPSPNGIRQAMLDWCRYRTSGYKNVDVTDFSPSWSDGLAFCAVVHSFFPDAFNFDDLDPRNVRANLQLAFDTAQQLGGVYPLLDAEDLVQAGANGIDWKCIFTYVNSIYAQLSAGGASVAKSKATAAADEEDGGTGTAEEEAAEEREDDEEATTESSIA